MLHSKAVQQGALGGTTGCGNHGGLFGLQSKSIDTMRVAIPLLSHCDALHPLAYLCHLDGCKPHATSGGMHQHAVSGPHDSGPRKRHLNCIMMHLVYNRINCGCLCPLDKMWSPMLRVGGQELRPS